MTDIKYKSPSKSKCNYSVQGEKKEAIQPAFKGVVIESNLKV